MWKARLGAAVASVLLAAAGDRVVAAQTSLLPSADTTLIELNPTNNFGASTFFNTGSIQNPLGTVPGFLYPRNRGLLKFDVGSVIPRGSRVTSVQLVVDVRKAPIPDEGVQTIDNDVHRMLKEWGEGNKTSIPMSTGTLGAPATLGEASWMSRLTGVADWDEPGGKNGTDYVSNATATVGLFDESTGPYFMNSGAFSNLTSDVQKWVDNPGTNFGWMLKARNEAPSWTAKRLIAREYFPGLNIYPYLLVDFIRAPQFDRVELNGSLLRLFFKGEANRNYKLQYREAIETGPWTEVTNVTVLPTPPFPDDMIPVELNDTVATNRSFYRLVTE